MLSLQMILRSLLLRLGLGLWVGLICAAHVSAQTAPVTETPLPEPSPKASGQDGTKTSPAIQGAAELKAVEIVGKLSDTEERRASTASKIVISKEDIERFGDSSVAEVLKRLPGVTSGGRPGRGGGDVRMRGMGGGYTQLLINGERMGPGYSLADIPPDQVERIEIMRAPTAEFGARAVAGTINVVLKEALKRELNEFRVGVGLEGGRTSPTLSWTRNDKAGPAIDYTFTVSATHTNRQDDVDNRTLWVHQPGELTVLEQHETGTSVSQRDGLHLNGRVQIKLGQGESLSVMPFAVLSQGATSAYGRLDQAAGGAIAQPYDSYQTDGSGSFGMLRINTQWQKRLSDATRMEMRVGVGTSGYSSQSMRQEFLATVLPSRVISDQSDTRDNTATVNAKLWHQLAGEHSLVGGLETDASQRTQTRTTLQDGLPILTEFGDNLNAATLRMAGYVQDEWNMSKQLSAYAGLRWEGIRTSSERANSSVSNLSSVVTPLFHATWRPAPDSRDQIRTSLTRSYKAATLSDLMARPSLSQRFPTGVNEISSPDSAGNPDLRPELASGVELGYEHYLTKGGLLSANLFYRSISNLIRRTLAYETVSWSDQQRWVSRPQNVGHAVAYGLELEAKFRLDELYDGVLPVSLRTNLSLFDSKVDGVAGPDNRLEGQPRGTANLGADYQLRKLPVSFGGSINYTPPYALQLSDVQSSTVSSKRVADVFALWRINPATQLRLSASNLLPRDYVSTSSWVNGTQFQNGQNTGVSRVNWGLRLEVKV